MRRAYKIGLISKEKTAHFAPFLVFIVVKLVWQFHIAEFYPTFLAEKFGNNEIEHHGKNNVEQEYSYYTERTRSVGQKVYKSDKTARSHTAAVKAATEHKHARRKRS